MAGEMYERIEKLEVARDKMLDYDLILHRIESIVGKPLGGRKELPTLVKAWVDRSEKFEILATEGESYKQILTRIGMLIGCEHLDDRLVASVQNAIKDSKELIATLGFSGTTHDVLRYIRILIEKNRDQDIQRGRLEEDCDRYKALLLQIGQMIGCEHLDERLPRCVRDVIDG
jgi:hypothetical protein